MICFRDMTFCSASEERCTNSECRRFFGERESAQARAWWGSDGAPVAFSDFSTDCVKRIDPTQGARNGAALSQEDGR